MYNVFTATRKDAKHLPKNSNLVNYSIFTELECKVPFRSFSIKYVVEGCESYVINGRPYNVPAGQYLLANQHSEGTAMLDSKNPVKGICIDLSNDMLTDVLASHRRPDTSQSDLDLGGFFSSNKFLENQYDSRLTAAGKWLQSLDKTLSKNPFEHHDIPGEFYYRLAENIVFDHVSILGQLKGIKSVKLETKKELFRRVNMGMEFINEHYEQCISIGMAAKYANMSEYHFFRIFRLVFGQSPYQYLLKKRLNMAMQLLKKQHSSVSEIAAITGFSDIHAFSKAFKKEFGCAPSVLSKTQLIGSHTSH